MPQQSDDDHEMNKLIVGGDNEEDVFEDASQEAEEKRNTSSSDRNKGSTKDEKKSGGDIENQNESSHKRDFMTELASLIYPTRLQHRLAHEKFGFLGMLTHTGPLIGFALFSGILSFLSSSSWEQPGTNATIALDSTSPEIVVIGRNSTSPDFVVIGRNYTSPDTDDGNRFGITESMKEIFIITIGVISLVQVAIQKLGQTYNYSARSDMHHVVQMSLKKLHDKIIFEEKKLAARATVGDEKSKLESSQLETFQELYEQCLESCDYSIPKEIAHAFRLVKEKLEGGGAPMGDERPKLEPSQLEKFQELYDQCLESCSSPIPIEIAQAFKLIEMECIAFIFKKAHERKKMKFEGEDKRYKLEPDPFENPQIFFYHAYEELYADITSRWYWRIYGPCPKKASERVIARMEEIWDYVFHNSNRKIHHRFWCCCQHTKFEKPSPSNQETSSIKKESC